MTRRDDLRSALAAKLATELGEIVDTDSELTEVYDLRGKIDGKHIDVRVTRHPAGENPESYAGREKWTVDLRGENGELIRLQNPQDSLAGAFDVIDWERVRRNFAE